MAAHLRSRISICCFPKKNYIVTSKRTGSLPAGPIMRWACHGVTLQHRLCSTKTERAAIAAYHKQGLNGFVYSLSVEERDDLLHMLSTHSSGKVTMPSPSQLRYVAIFSGVPFIGFGILDNTIMLTAGEYIDITFGAWLGITTMAAAALGNMISDVLGITTAGFVEQTALKFGLKAPPITLEQMSLRRTRIMANLGRCIGVCIGCLLGMWPLLVFTKDKSEAEDKSKSDQTD
ncbi:transmembrane protein 65-like [Watersipora subatra]|uniref:transmembrane protein 65-like n=1 Tax=Watersipora subatra TaxID=2589382 RepID=UPI00355B77DD